MGLNRATYELHNVVNDRLMLSIDAMYIVHRRIYLRFPVGRVKEMEAQSVNV